MKTAVIDVGSNSVRYAVMDENTVMAKKSLITTVLSDGLFFTGRLSDAAIKRTAEAVSTFCDRAKADGATEILIFATEAVRAAENGKQFTDEVYRKTGLPVDVIQGGTEALIGFVGAISNRTDCVTVFDLGGASCEIICGSGGKPSFEKSYPVGCIRLRDGSGGNREEAERILGSLLKPTDCRGDIIGIGGTATALGAMLACPCCYDPVKVHSQQVDADFLRNVTARFFDGENLQTAYPCLTPNRSAIIGYGALAVLHVLKVLGRDSFTVSERDNIEGYYAYKKSQAN